MTDQGAPRSNRPGDTGGHLRCPFCSAYEVSRMYLASLRLDSCECVACGARWHEEVDSGVGPV